MAPDALSIVNFEEIANIELNEPEIDLNSTCFDDPDYKPKGD